MSFETFLRTALNTALSKETRTYALKQARQQYTSQDLVSIVDSPETANTAKLCLTLSEDEAIKLLLENKNLPAIVSNGVSSGPKSSALSLYDRRDQLAIAGGGGSIVNAAKRVVSPILAKHGINEPFVDRFKVVVDVSGSMEGLFACGYVQTLTERALAMAHRVLKNDQATVGTIGFGTEAVDTGDITAARYAQAAMDITNKYRYDRNTDYAPALELAVGKGKFSDVIYILMVTDGNNNGSKQRFTAVVNSIKHKRVFVQAMGLGENYVSGSDYEARGIYSQLVKAEKDCDYFGFFGVADPTVITDEYLFDNMIAKFASWAKANRILDHTGMVNTSGSTALSRILG